MCFGAIENGVFYSYKNFFAVALFFFSSFIHTILYTCVVVWSIWLTLFLCVYVSPLCAFACILLLIYSSALFATFRSLFLYNICNIYRFLRFSIVDWTIYSIMDFIYDNRSGKFFGIADAILQQEQKISHEFFHQTISFSRYVRKFLSFYKYTYRSHPFALSLIYLLYFIIIYTFLSAHHSSCRLMRWPAERVNRYHLAHHNILAGRQFGL